MAKRKYITSHSNFILKSKHQSLENGTIFERDYMTIGSLNGFAPGQIPVYGESNFKMTIRNGLNGQIKHRYGNWDSRNGECADTSDSTIWTLNCLSDDIVDNETISLKPNYTSLLDFAYYGSAVELIHASINDIINKFPAELYLTNKQLKYFKNNTSKKSSILGEDKYIVDNPYNIDLLSQSIANIDVINKNRYFCSSYYLYELYDENNNKVSNIEWNVEINKKNCYENGDKIATIYLGICNLYYYYLDGNKILLHDGKYINYHIRPNESLLNDFFNNLDDFQSLLLNRQSNPLYKAVLDTPLETDTGVIVYKKNYIWPVLNKWNLDISSPLYTNYLNSLLEIAEYYDEYYTNNLWRSLTHDSIKNLDFTYEKVNSDDTVEDYTIGTSRLESIFVAYGRQFDDLKRYIDNIKYINNITYNGKNNLPDYFLTDSVELSGWDVVNAMPTQDKTIYTKALFSGEYNGYNSNDANIEFLKRLKLNSKYILSSKGTINSIEMMLNLFGLKKYNRDTQEGDFIINEYVAISNLNSIEHSKEEFFNKVVEYNRLKNNFFYESSESNTNTNDIQGLPVKLITLYDENTQNTIEYLVPWFDKLEDIDGNPYFQMNGGWEKTFSKEINLEIAPNIKEISETDNIKIYGESSKYLNIVRNLSELLSISLQKLSNNDIYYVYDTTDLNTNSYSHDDDIVDFNNLSHYFILKDINNSNLLGYKTIDGIKNEGWISIKNDDISEGKSDDGIRVLYLESIVDYNAGNNPHTGKGKYDDGNEYLNYFRQLFKYSIENNNFSEDAYDCESGELIDDIKNIGYEVYLQKDSMKCWYFTDTQNKDIVSQNGKKIPLELEAKNCDLGDNANYCGYEQIINNTNDIINVGEFFENKIFESEIVPLNPEFEIGNTEYYDEAAANSIINVKNIEIKFVGKIVNETDVDTNNNPIGTSNFKYFAKNVIMFYVKQLIPSTAILKISFENE